MSIFTQIQAKKPQSNTFDLSHDKKMSLNMGDLVPHMIMDLIPGDKISISTTQLLRLTPLIAPVMHKINVYTHFYFVPNRIIWADWEKWITGANATDPTPLTSMGNTVTQAFVETDNGLVLAPDVQAPYINSASAENGSLPDYLGIPQFENTTAADSRKVSALPYAAYQKIYQEYYRDQNLIPEETTMLVSGDNASNQTSLETLRKRAWQHDYFTSALPWTQKGPEATIPLGTTANLIHDLSDHTKITPLNGAGIGIADGDLRANGDGDSYYNPPSGIDQNVNFDITPHTTVDLTSATAASINDLRQAFKLQEWLEKNARGGTRYNESIKSHFGVTSPDARLQRPEYLGGGKSPVTISEVLQTSETDDENQGTPQGNMAGHGISVGANAKVTYYAKEHGYIIGIMSILPKTAYYQGIPRHFQKFDKFDYYWPSFAHLGEQPIYSQELYLEENDGKDTDVFGYTPRYAEYKNILSSVHGEFRDTLDFWHMARKFTNRPNLNEDFITSDPTTRIFAVEGTEQNPVETIYCHLHNRVKAKRLMPFFGTPHI